MAELMAKEAFRKRIERLATMKREDPERFRVVCRRLQEKGTEYVVLMPFFEVMLDYDPLEHISFERSSVTNNNQRFDMIVESDDKRSMLIEAKALDTDLTARERKQLTDYISTNREHSWGILTNGFDWWFFIERHYVEAVANKGQELPQKKEDVFCVMHLSVEEPHFFDFMAPAFSYAQLDGTWERIANYARREIQGGRGPKPHVHSGKESVNEYAQEKISEQLYMNTGEYHDAITSRQLQEGQEVVCENDFLRAEFVLSSGGMLILTNGGIKDSLQFQSKCYEELWHDWIRDQMAFNSPRDFRLQIDREFTSRQTDNLVQRYPFSIAEPETYSG